MSEILLKQSGVVDFPDISDVAINVTKFEIERRSTISGKDGLIDVVFIADYNNVSPQLIRDSSFFEKNGYLLMRNTAYGSVDAGSFAFMPIRDTSESEQEIWIPDDRSY